MAPTTAIIVEHAPSDRRARRRSYELLAERCFGLIAPVGHAADG